MAHAHRLEVGWEVTGVLEVVEFVGSDGLLEGIWLLPRRLGSRMSVLLSTIWGEENKKMRKIWEKRK